jgi:hypothetical protein
LNCAKKIAAESSGLQEQGLADQEANRGKVPTAI